MDQFLTYKKGNLGPVFNFTAFGTQSATAKRGAHFCAILTETITSKKK